MSMSFLPSVCSPHLMILFYHVTIFMSCVHILTPLYTSLYCQVIFLKNSRNFYCYSQINEPRKWTFLCIWYENRGCRVHEVERLSFRSTWPCVYPSFYGSEPPVSTRITILRVLTSFVPPVHNQGASSAPNQGHALWKIFLPATGSFFI